MTSTKDLPEQASEEPVTVTPEQDAERAARRVEASEDLTGDDAMNLADPRSPLRVPGELSSKPRERAHEDRSQSGRPGLSREGVTPAKARRTAGGAGGADRDDE